MQYRNIKTGALIETVCPVSGENWVEVKTADPEKKTNKKEKDSKDDAQ